MRRCAWISLSTIGLLWVFIAGTNAQSAQDTADAHVAAAKAPSVQHYLTIAAECAKAGRLRLK